MSIGAFLITALIESIAPGPRVLACTFPANTPAGRPISVAVEAQPSLLDRIDQFRVRLYLSDDHDVTGLAQPIDRTDDRDVLIRAQAYDDLFYTIGLRDDGIASLNMLQVRDAVGDEVDERRQETRRGNCRDFQEVLDGWLRS